MMDHETSSLESDIFIFEMDGSKSEPSTPLAPEERAALLKMREKYVKAGLMPPLPSKTTETEPPHSASK